MAFGFGFSMPHLRTTSGVPLMTVRGAVSLATVKAYDTLFGGPLTISSSAIAGDVAIVVFSDDSGLAPAYTSNPTGWSGPTQVANVGGWYVFQYIATGTSSSFSVNATPSGSQYCFAAAWVVRGANAIPYESAAATAVSPISGSPVSLSITTTANNDCVLGVAYALPFPVGFTVHAIDAFAPTSSGWTSVGPAQDGNLDACFWRIQNPNIPLTGTTTLNANVSGLAISVLTVNLKK